MALEQPPRFLLARLRQFRQPQAAELLSKVQEYVGFHLARYVKTKKLRGVKVRPFSRDELEMLHAQLRQERDFQAGASGPPNALEQ